VTHDPKETVRRGYDAVSWRYRGDDDDPPHYGPWLTALRRELRPGARVLDIGCGNGVPVARALVAWGYDVTGVDISDVQVERARALVPGAEFIRGDAVELDVALGSLDAVISLFSLIHMPMDDQEKLIMRIGTWLRPGGRLLATTGATAWTGIEDNWLGGSARMWWSHPDAGTYRRWITAAGLVIDLDEFVPEGDGGHQLLGAHKR
jgi:SAM-dependent methyltransferase